jgi:hypothetical protein
VVCYQLWENIVGRPGGPITEAHLREAGDVDKALTHFYEETLAAVLAEAPGQASERQLRAWFHRELITETGTRNVVRQGDQRTGSLPNSAVKLLQKHFLVRGETRSGDTWVELVHDRFIEPIRQSNLAWFNKNLNSIAVAAQTWKDTGKGSARLYEGRQLADAIARIEASPTEFGDLEQEYIEAGREARRRLAARRQGAFNWVLLGFVLVFAVLLVWSTLNLSRALQARSAAIDAQNTAVAAGDQAATDAAIARSVQSTSDAASTAAVADRSSMVATVVYVETRSAYALHVLATEEASLISALTAMPSPTVILTLAATPTPAGSYTPPPTRAIAPTPNRTVIAQETQLAQIQAAQTAIAFRLSITRVAVAQPTQMFAGTPVVPRAESPNTASNWLSQIRLQEVLRWFLIASAMVGLFLTLLWLLRKLFGSPNP